MPDVNNILFQLQSKLSNGYDKQRLSFDNEAMFGPGFNSYPNDTDSSKDKSSDVPSVADTNYKTFVQIPVPRGKKRGSNYLPAPTGAESVSFHEQEDEEKLPPAEVPVDDVGAPPAEDIGTPDAGVGVDPTMGVDPAMGGLGEEEPKTAGELGRVFELKKIYARLTSIESYLSNESSKTLTEIRSYVSQAIELFEVIASNFDSYKNKLDEIIVMYYKFIMETYEQVKNYYKKASQQGDK